jgi:hypothetical protein
MELTTLFREFIMEEKAAFGCDRKNGDVRL